MMRPIALATLALPLLVACGPRPANDGDDDRPSPPVPVDEEAAIRAACAADDARLGLERPAGWDALSHCTRAPADVARVFGDVPTLAITMRADEYAAMQADLEELTGGEGGGGDDPFVTACVGLAFDEACEVDAGRGPEAGRCADFDGVLACIPESFRPPAEWIEVCVGQRPGTPCTTTDHDGLCLSDGLSFACFDVDDPGPGPGPAGDIPCAGASDGDDCSNGGARGVCVPAGRPAGAPALDFLVCATGGLDDGNVDQVPLEAAAPFWPREPAWFHADVSFDGVPFTTVGIRYKGNNGLASSRGEKKPLRLKLDHWEDETPGVTDQRLFGFQHLSLSPNQTDPSHLHQVLAAEVFRDHGVPAPQAGWVEVTIDTGDGPRLLGLYALTEIPDNPLLERVFGSDDGPLYKPDGRGAHFVSFHEASFHRQSRDDGTFDDVVAFIDALHADQRDPAAWREGLRATFDVDAFAHFFGVNQTIGNWDTYGGLAHNFYLYGDPARGGQLRFIAWDFDLSFDGTGQTDLTLGAYDGSWPLLQAVARDPELSAIYHAAIIETAAELDGPLDARIDDLIVRIEGAIARENEVHRGTTRAFVDAVESLRAHNAAQAEHIDAHLRALGLR